MGYPCTLQTPSVGEPLLHPTGSPEENGMGCRHLGSRLNQPRRGSDCLLSVATGGVQFWLHWGCDGCHWGTTCPPLHKKHCPPTHILGRYQVPFTRDHLVQKLA